MIASVLGASSCVFQTSCYSSALTFEDTQARYIPKVLPSTKSDPLLKSVIVRLPRARVTVIMEVVVKVPIAKVAKREGSWIQGHQKLHTVGIVQHVSFRHELGSVGKDGSPLLEQPVVLRTIPKSGKQAPVKFEVEVVLK